MLHDPALQGALRHTLFLGVVCVLVATPLGVALALGLQRWRGPGGGTINTVMLLPLVTPEIVMGVALLLLFLQVLPGIGLGSTAQAIGQVTFTISYVVVIVRGRLVSIGKDYEEAAADLGAPPHDQLLRVLLPLLAPAIIASAAVVFAISLDDFVVTQYLSGDASTTTVSMLLYASARAAPTPALNALATIALLITLADARARLSRLPSLREQRRCHRDGRRGGLEAMQGEIQLEELTKKFGEVAAVDGIDLQMPAGEFFTMVGPSGCGKTTTLRMIAGFERPTSGRIVLDDVDVAQVPPHKRNVNTVFQSYALFPHLDVAGNVAFGLKYKKLTKEEQRKRVAEALALVQLGDFAKRKPAQLSGGQQQRVALARALVLTPQVLLLDEPLGALDARLRKDLQVELKALQAELGITFVFVTHDQEEALTMSDRVAVMSGGRVEQAGTPREIYEEPATEFVADFLGVSNLLDGDASADGDGCALRVGERTLQATAGATGARGDVKAMIRPERVGRRAAGHGGRQPAAGARRARGVRRLGARAARAARRRLAAEGDDRERRHAVRLRGGHAGDAVPAARRGARADAVAGRRHRPPTTPSRRRARRPQPPGRCGRRLPCSRRPTGRSRRRRTADRACRAAGRPASRRRATTA